MSKPTVTRRVNIRPDDIAISTSRWLCSPFKLTFIEHRNGAEIRYIVHMDMFWLSILAEKLHDVIKCASASLRDSLDALKG